ncbi:MAG TPA: hypothetical protein VNG33_05450 [Polyangiaceae bacterium]|nr:hypothetical protein [Polyangiaceae bacterium]
MNEPRRLSQSGGVSQRLLDSASIDKPSAAARRRAALLAATASSFSTTSSRSSSAPAALPRVSVAKTLATWIVIGAAASATLALLGSKLLDSSRDAASPRAAAPTLAELAPAPSAASRLSPDIVAEPKRSVTAPSIAATPAQPPASAEEIREIEAARGAVKRGDDAGAIAALDEYERAHPDGRLGPDALALRIQALSHSGKAPEAQKLLSEFQRRYPENPLLNQLRSLGR